MKPGSVIPFLFLLMCMKLHAGNSDSTSIHKKYRTLHFYTYGLPAYDWTSGNTTDCEKAVEKKYGLEYVMKAGCVVRHTQQVRWDWHNNRIDRKLTRRFGEKWYDQFMKEMGNCNDKK